MTPEGEKAIAYPTIQKELGNDAMDSIMKQIRDSGIMDKPCQAEMVTDYYVNYLIRLDGAKKEIKFPGCEPELNAIDAVIGAAAETLP